MLWDKCCAAASLVIVVIGFRSSFQFFRASPATTLRFATSTGNQKGAISSLYPYHTYNYDNRLQITKHKTSIPHTHKKKKKKRTRMDLLLFTTTAAAVLWELKQKHRPTTLVLSRAQLAVRFPSLQLDRTPLVGLLFAASWCDDCWETVPVIEQVAAVSKDDICIHYISSDRTAVEMKQYCNATVFRAIPFENESERNALKRHFQTCAKKEMEQVGVLERKHGTPTLIVLDPATGRVLTEKGVDDCVQRAPDAVAAWKALLVAAGS